MNEYKKPIDKTTLTVEFQIKDAAPDKDFRQKMELMIIPDVGDLFFDPTNQKRAKIIEVIYVPWNPSFPDVVVVGTYI